MIKFFIKDLANNDNEVVEVRRNHDEYEIVVNCWDGSTFYIQTLNCTEIMYNPQLVSEIGDIDINDREYKFKSVCSDEVFLRVCADSFVLVDKEKKGLDNEKRAESLIKKLGFDNKYKVGDYSLTLLFANKTWQKVLTRKLGGSIIRM
ncbi:MAG: hypothetical protein K2I03_07295 [Lachnospiraceae bacterium]|nr:hypothetical protein [Lachnospiraceae bacterium]